MECYQRSFYAFSVLLLSSWQAPGETRTSKGFPRSSLSIFHFLFCFHLTPGRLVEGLSPWGDFQKLAYLLYFQCCHYASGRHLERPEPQRDFQELVSPFLFLWCFHLPSGSLLEGLSKFIRMKISPTSCSFLGRPVSPRDFQKLASLLYFLCYNYSPGRPWRDQNLQGISRNWSLQFFLLCCFHLPSGKLLEGPSKIIKMKIWM